MQRSATGRILALVIRSGRFGYAAFELPAHLLDFGVSTFTSRAKARIRTQTLLTRFQPTSLVLSNGWSRRNSKWRKSISRMIHEQSRNASVPFTVISARELRVYFYQHGKRNKYDFAVVAATWFPDIQWKLQRKSRFYSPEPWKMTAVDAVILGAVHLRLQKLIPE
jgi:hypothetical protein